MTVHQFMRAKPGTSFLILVVVMLLIFVGVTANAQTWHGYSISQPPADCNLKRISSDNFIGDGRRGTIVAPRYQLHLISIASSALAAVAVRKILRLSPIRSAAFAGVATGLLPHYRSVILQRRYPIDPGDFVADATMRMIPFIVVDGHRDHSFSGNVRTAFTVVASYSAVACWAHP